MALLDTTQSEHLTYRHSMRENSLSEGQGFSPVVENTFENRRGQGSNQEHTASLRASAKAHGWLNGQEIYARLNGAITTLRTNRAVQLLLVFTVALITIGAGDTGQFSSIGHKMMCVCGCGQILLECNHVGCPDSDRMIRELRAQVATGGTDTSIFNWFVAKYGPTVLAAPIRGGFDNAAWIIPVIVFLCAIGGTIVLIRRWKGRHMVPAGGPAIPYTTGDDSMRDRIRRETEY